MVGPNSFGQFAKIVQGHADASWLSALHAWWLRHGYYPEDAARLGQDGQVRIELVVDRYGRVRTVGLTQRSGSPFLDMGALSVFRDAQLPSLVPFTTDDQITLDLSIDYVLVGRR